MWGRGGPGPRDFRGRSDPEAETEGGLSVCLLVRPPARPSLRPGVGCRPRWGEGGGLRRGGNRAAGRPRLARPAPPTRGATGRRAPSSAAAVCARGPAGGGGSGPPLPSRPIPAASALPRPWPLPRGLEAAGGSGVPALRRPLSCGTPGAPVTLAVCLQRRPWKEERCKRRESERGKELPELRE